MAVFRPTSRRARLAALTASPALALSAGAAAAAAGFSAVARVSARRESSEVDELVRQKLEKAPQHPIRRAARQVAPLGKWYAYIPAALALAAYSQRARHTGFGRPSARDRRAGSAAIIGAALLSYGLGKAADRWLPQPPAPPGHRRNKPVFPSGHAFGPGAVGLTAAYVLSRQGQVRPAAAVPIAATLPLVLAASRLVEERHWASDVLGGYLAAVAVAGGCTAAYESQRSN